MRLPDMPAALMVIPESSQKTLYFSPKKNASNPDKTQIPLAASSHFQSPLIATAYRDNAVTQRE